MVFTIYGRGGLLGFVTWAIYTNVRFPFSWRLYMKFGLWLVKLFRRRSLKMVDDAGRTTDGRISEHGYTICLPCEPNC